ncbi:MAG: hypothetical protein K0S76_810 [Herbinix sp.]|nr:hypothetical protein [Herbinix sp.]
MVDISIFPQIECCKANYGGSKLYSIPGMVLCKYGYGVGVGFALSSASLIASIKRVCVYLLSSLISS